MRVGRKKLQNKASHGIISINVCAFLTWGMEENDMRKVFLVVLAVLLACSSLVAALASDFGLGELLDSVYNNSSSMMPQNITMPKKFSITYEYVENGKFLEVTLEKDESENYHYKDDEDEYLFVKDGKGYRIAVGTVSGFVYKNNEKYTFDRIKELTQRFWGCATPLDDDFTMGTTTKEGSGEICGRKTDKFKVDFDFGYNFGGYSMSMSEATFYDFDLETGICLASSSNEAVNVMGMNAGDGEQAGFECIRFELESVLLPAVE